MSYADFAAVQARAGRFAAAFQVAGKHPDQADVTALLADITAELDAAIRARGHDPASIDVSAKNALKDLTAYGALARALPAASADRQADELSNRARDFYAAGLEMIADGTLPAIAEIEAGVGGGGVVATAGDFWSDEPDYPTEADLVTATRNPFEFPSWVRGMTL